MTGDTVNEPSPGGPEKEPPNTVATLMALLTAEGMLLTRLRSIAEERCNPRSELENTQRDLNHENVFHIARFFYLLKALNCSTSAALSTFIDSHNARVQALLDSENYKLRTKRELENARIKRQQKFVMLETIDAANRPVFAKTEVAHFLFDHMGRDSAVKTVDLMVQAGLLIEGDDPLDGSNRKLIQTDGAIENAVHDYLESIRIAVTAGGTNLA